MMPWGRNGVPIAAPTESMACRSEHHELCALPGCPCSCRHETPEARVSPTSEEKE